MDEHDRPFYDVVDKFINLANQLVVQHGLPRVSATLLFAASRLNAHNFYASDGKPVNRDHAVQYFCEQYRKMLTQNLAELERFRAGSKDRE